MKKLILLPLCLLLNSCDRLQTKSVDYYLEHEDEMLDRVKHCSNTTNRAEANSEDCENARIARSKASLKNNEPFPKRL